jgi:hypothetical protein
MARSPSARVRKHFPRTGKGRHAGDKRCNNYKTTNIIMKLQAIYTIIALCTGIGCTVFIWLIIGMPWPKKKPEAWKEPKIVDYNLSSKVDKMIAAQRHLAKAAENAIPALVNAAGMANGIVLDEHETKIS